MCRELEEGAPLVTVLGPAGIGKTRVARRAGRMSASHYPGGVWFCDCTAAKTREDFLAVVARAIDVPLLVQPDLREAAHQLGDAIEGHGRTLVILIGVERVAESVAAAAADWLERAPGAQLLVTSMVRLGMEGETCFELPPLPPEPAVALYEDRARRARGDLQAPEPEVVGELVARLDHLPLAIELAASRAAVLSPRQLLARINRRLDLLHAGERPLGRHSSLAGAIGFAWELLSPHERLGLAWCSVFQGGFTADAAEDVLNEGKPEDAPEVLDLLASLREKSLLRPGEDRPDRLYLFESVRDFAARQLEESGLRETAESSHLDWCLELGERLIVAAEGRSGAEACRRLADERDNLLAAHLRAVDSGPEACARIGLVLVEHAAQRGPPEFEADVVERTVAAARRADDEQLIARALGARAAFWNKRIQLQNALRDLDEALRIARRLEDIRLEGHLLSEAGRLWLQRGELERAAADLGRAVEALSAEGERHLEARALNRWAPVEGNRGNLAEAGSMLERALSLFESVGDERSQGLVRVNLGVLRTRQGRLEDALALLESASNQLDSAGDRANYAHALVNIGHVALGAGNLDMAESRLEEALVLERSLGNRGFEAIALANLGLVALERDDPRLARRRLQDSIAIVRAAGAQRLQGVYRAYFAAVETILGLDGEARSDFAEARALLEKIGNQNDRDVLAVLEGFLDLAEARRAAEGLDFEAAEATRAKIHQKLDSNAGEAIGSAEMAIALRILKRALCERSAGREPSLEDARLSPGEDDLLVSSRADWFQPPGGERVDISRRGALRRILQALVEHRLSAPGKGIPRQQMFEVGWPEERARSSAAAARVYVAVRTLRTLGLDGMLLRHDDGYLLDPSVPLARARG